MKTVTERRIWLRRMVLLTAVLVAVSGWFAVQRILRIATVQDALERDWEINFNAGECPSALPHWLDDSAKSLIRRVLGPEPKRPFLCQKLSRDTVWHERFRGLFRGRITEIEIFYPGRLRDDLGAALAQFSALRRLTIHKADFSDSDWAYVFAGLQRLQHLEELSIGSYELRDSSIEPLAGQASLRKVEITVGKLGTQSIDTFSKMPELINLTLDSSVVDDGHRWPTRVLPEIQQMFREGLPHVTIQF